MRKQIDHITNLRKVTYYFSDDLKRLYPRESYVSVFADVLGKINEIEDKDTRLHWYEIYDRAMDLAAIRETKKRKSWDKIIIEKVERPECW